MSKISWDDHFKAQSLSGLGVDAYCRKAGVSTSAFYYHKKKVKSSHSKNFVPVIVEQDITQPELSLNISFDTNGEFIVKGKLDQLIALTTLLRRPS